MAIQLFPKLDLDTDTLNVVDDNDMRDTISTGQMPENSLEKEIMAEYSDKSNYEPYAGIVLDPKDNIFKTVDGMFRDKKEFYEKLTARGYVVRKVFEKKVFDWIEENAKTNMEAYLMFSTAFSKWKGNNLLNQYYEKLLTDIPQLNREREKGNPNTRGNYNEPSDVDEAVITEDKVKNVTDINGNERTQTSVIVIPSFDGIHFNENKAMEFSDILVPALNSDNIATLNPNEFIKQSPDLIKAIYTHIALNKDRNQPIYKTSENSFIQTGPENTLIIPKRFILQVKQPDGTYKTLNKISARDNSAYYIDGLQTSFDSGTPHILPSISIFNFAKQLNLIIDNNQLNAINANSKLAHNQEQKAQDIIIGNSGDERAYTVADNELMKAPNYKRIQSTLDKNNPIQQKKLHLLSSDERSLSPEELELKKEYRNLQDKIKILNDVNSLDNNNPTRKGAVNAIKQILVDLKVLSPEVSDEKEILSYIRDGQKIIKDKQNAILDKVEIPVNFEKTKKARIDDIEDKIADTEINNFDNSIEKVELLRRLRNDLNAAKNEKPKNYKVSDDKLQTNYTYPTEFPSNTPQSYQLDNLYKNKGSKAKHTITQDDLGINKGIHSMSKRESSVWSNIISDILKENRDDCIPVVSDIQPGKSVGQNAVVNYLNQPVQGVITNPGAIGTTGIFLSEEEAAESNNKELNPKLFDGTTLKDDVRTALLEIADTFKKTLGLNIEPVDVYFTGSNANYNYNEHSDIDLHLVYDFEKVGINAEILIKYFIAKKQLFNTNYDIKVKDIPVEVGCEDLNNPIVSTAVYSLVTNDWVIEPSYSRELLIATNRQLLNKTIKEIESTIETNNVDKIASLWDKLYKMRADSLIKDGEKGEDNIIFKKLRGLGYLDRLKDAYYANASKELSLESLKEI